MAATISIWDAPTARATNQSGLEAQNKCTKGRLRKKVQMNREYILILKKEVSRQIKKKRIRNY